MEQIDINDFLKLKTKSIQIIDIREQYEFEEGHISKLNIPMDQILDSIDRIEKKIPVIIYCNSGKRGASVVHVLRKKYSMKNVSNLLGGYQAYLEKK
tara:strand:- start:186 stop:476 length:291 start_codon:yes stop_codon:yes gene_type:complete